MITSKQLRIRLLEMDLTQQKIGAQLGLKQNTVSQILNGVTPGKRHQRAIAEMLGFDISELFPRPEI